MKTIEELEKQREELHKQARQISDQIDEVTEKEMRPKYQKQYVGKYFKFDNGYSATDRWFLYQKVLEITEVYGTSCRVSVIGFQTIGGMVEIRAKDNTSVSVLGDEITKAEFMREYKKALKQVTL